VDQAGTVGPPGRGGIIARLCFPDPFTNIHAVIVRLSKLKLAGFKSFVDPTTIYAPGQLVGIVGPNGCGKSNVIDAVRWVLGESRASALRGESMQDVIFNGSTTRKPVSRASVEMVFDNSEGKAAGQWSQYAEISVKRQVDRSGGSDYFINNVTVRRKDVIDLFLGTGLGPRAYAIIEQGMISRVIEARPEEVRSFLEEAAGITKYKERRRETEGRLGDARDNLARVEDIRAELGQQIDKLAVQAELAHRYKDLTSQLSQRQVLLWRYKYTSAQQELVTLAETIARSQTSIEEHNHHLVEAETRLTLAREAQTVQIEAVSSAQQDVFAITSEITRIESELKNLRDAHARISQRGAQLLADKTLWEERRSGMLEQQEVQLEQNAIAQERLEVSLEQVAEAESHVPVAEQAWRDAVARRDEARRAVAGVEQQVQVEHTKYSAGQRALEALAERRRRMEVERAGLNPEDEEALGMLEHEVEELVGLQQAIETELVQRQTQVQGAQTALTASQQAVQRQTQTVTEKNARLEALKAVQAGLRKQGSMADWLGQLQLEDEAQVWQALQVQPGWELAVEAVLRERIAAIGPLESARLVDAAASSAPATVMLLRQGTLPAPRAPLFEAPLLEEYVSCTQHALAPYLRTWLDGVYAVENIDAWLSGGTVVPPGVMLVSRQGQVLTSGSLTLFAPEAATHGVIERAREIEDLVAEVRPLEADLERLHAEVEEAEGSLAEARSALAEARDQQQLLQSRLHQRQMDFVKAQQVMARQTERLGQLAAESAEIQKQEVAEQARLDEADGARQEAEMRVDALRESVETAEETALECERILRAHREALTALQKSRHEAEFAVREGNAKVDELRRNIELAQTQLDKCVAEQAQLSQDQGSLDDSELRLSLQTALELKRSREETLARRRGEQDEAAQLLKSLEEIRVRAEHALGPLREQVAELRLKHQAAELGSTQASERLGEFGAEVVMLDDAVMADIREQALTREVNRLTREIADMGAVNMAALAELEAATERKRFLDMQFDDLMRAIETLEEAIRRIDKDTREQLNETFAVVNKHFGELFPRLFGGGNAQLVLTGDEILDSGVQIVAQPPGKKNASIQLLSGGEKALTAIALVFAMFQLNPAPFCMLDEVDAPLDDANTERYGDMVKHMSSATQFIFISHSKITMEIAEQLVGVTMQEQGVSRVVEVDMAEALKLAQPEAA